MYKRVKTPTVIQMEAVECGAAALGIILGYHQRFLPLEELRVACGVSRDGSTVFNIKRAAEGYGLDTKAYRRSAQDLKSLEPPFIVFWNFNHFLVVEGFQDDAVFLNDPGNGPRKISFKEFKDQYSEVVLVFTKTENFQPGGNPPQIWPAIVKRLSHVKNSILFLFLAGLGVMVTTAIYPTLTKVFFDTILGEEVYNWTKGFILIFFVLIAISGLLIWLQQYLLIRLNGKLSIRFSADYLQHILRLPLNFYQQRFGGEIAYRLSLNDVVINTLTGKLATTFLSMIFIIFYGFLMFAFDWALASIALFCALLNFAAVIAIQRFRNDAYANLQQDYGKFFGFAIGGLYYMESIKASGQEGDFFARLIGYFNRSLNTEQRLGEKNTQVAVVPTFLQLVTTVALFSIGGWQMMSGHFTMGLFIALQTLIANFNAPVLQMSQLGEDIQTVKIDMARIDDVMNNPPDPHYDLNPVAEGRILERLTGKIELKNIFFGYSPLDPPLIRDFNLQLEPGQRVAFVGSTGCGKTTIARLISGLFFPWSGDILFDGKKRKELTREETSHSLATVDQEIFLFAGTIRENITLFDKNFTDEEIIHAAQDACIHDEIIQKPYAYDFVLTEGGSNLSGGQRQRLEIARALLQNPSILILDEATSALDSKTEERIMKNVKKRGCTCIMVAHRLSTIRDCDEILVMKEGAVIQRGNHETLKNETGAYRDLVTRDV